MLTQKQAGADTGRAAEMLAGQFNLNLSEIREVAELASADEYGALTDRLWATCRDLTRPKLDKLAQRLDVKAGWDDLILPDEQMTLMRRIAAQIRVGTASMTTGALGRR